MLFSPYEDFIYRDIYKGQWCSFFALLDFSGASGVSGAGKVERSFLENLRLFSFAGVLKSYLVHAVL